MMLTIRDALPPDVAELASLAALTFPLACPPELPSEAVEQFIRAHLGQASFEAYLDDPTHTVLIGCDRDDRVRAYALLVDGTAMDEHCSPLIDRRPTVGVSKFYVDPALHGSGAAALLLEATAMRALGSGALSLWLATNVGNARARAFYVRYGFREKGHRTFDVGGVVNDDVVYELPLGATRSAADGIEAR